MCEVGELSRESVAGGGSCEEGAEQHDGVDRFSPLLRPVVVLEIEPERELIQRQSGACAVGEGGRA